MTNNLLYFPYINVPYSDWTVRTLLYYDKVASIVPSEFFYDPEKNYEPFMLELVKQELIIPINPIEVLENPWQLNKPFLHFINSEVYKIKDKRETFQIAAKGDRINKHEFSEQPAMVSSLKFDKELMYNLTQLGLAKHSNNNWYFIEQFTANYLMAYLASVIAGKLNMLPITDRQFSVDFLRQFREVDQKINSKRDFILNQLIPMPKEINLRKVQNFKEKNIDSLRRFSNVVEQIALNPIYDDERLLDEKIKELDFEKKELTAKMDESKFGSIFFGTACGIFGAFHGLSQANTTAALIGGLPGFASAIYAALKLEKAESIFDQTGLKYLSLTDRYIRFFD